MVIHGWLSVKQLPAMQETCEARVQSLGREDPLEVKMLTHSSETLLWTEGLEAYSPQGCKELDTI